MAWCYLPETDCPSAPEPAALILASCLPSQASTPDALSSGRNTPGNPSLQDNGPDTSRPRRSGTTSQPLTPDPSGGRSTLCLPDTPASLSALRVSEKAQTTNATYGRMSPASLPSFGPDGSFLKTSQDTFHLASIPCCEKYGTWATRLRLAYSQRRKSVQAMSASGCSSWLTAKAVTGGANSQRESRGAGGPDLQEMAQTWMTPRTGAGEYTRDGGAKGAERLTLEGQASMWMTPDTPGGGRKMPAGTTITGQTPDGRKVTVGLENQATMWGTPRGSDGEKGGPNMAFGAGGTPLPAQAAKWPTPASRDHKGENSADHLKNGTGRLHLDQLPNAVAFLFSHPDQETLPHGRPSFEWRPISRRLFRLAMSSASPTTVRRWLRMGAWRKRRLNPCFVEWLQGFPTGHALSGYWETQSFRSQPLMRGEALPSHMGSTRSNWSEDNDHHEKLRDMRSDIQGRETEEPILQQAMPILSEPHREGVCADIRRLGASSDHGATSWPQTDDIRACAPQERGQARQPVGELGVDDRAGPRESAQVQAPKDKGLFAVRPIIHAAPADQRASQNLLKGMSIRTGYENPSMQSFLTWQRAMRSALSRQPMASGPWIWKPPAPEVETMQLDMFGGQP